jgi:hypothetical protein
MIVTYLRQKDRYVDQAGRTATVSDYGRDFYKCEHNFQDTGRRGEVLGPNGKQVPAAAYQCNKCFVYTTIELKR